MLGIRIYGQGHFNDYFDHIFSSTEDYYWIVSKYGFYIHHDNDDIESELVDEFDKGIVLENNENILVDNKFMKKYSSFLRNDWNELVCLRNGRKHFEEISNVMMSELWLSSEPEQTFWKYNTHAIKKGWGIEFIVYNWDGSFWEFIDCNGSYSQTLINKINTLPGVAIEEVSH